MNSTDALLRFVAPGFLHELANVFLQIQGRAELLGLEGRDAAAEGHCIRAACVRAGASMDVYRFLANENDADSPGPVGPLILSVAELLRIPMRTRGLSLDVDEGIEANHAAVPRRTLALAVIQAGYALCESLPTGFRGRFSISMDPAGVKLSVHGDPDLLPFDVDPTPAATAVVGLHVRCVPQGLIVILPVEAARGAE